MDTVSFRMTPFPPKMVPFDFAAKRVVFSGPVFICRNVDEGAPRCIMLEVDTTLVTELVPLPPCSGASSGMVTGGRAAVDAAWGSWGWTYGGAGAVIGACSCRAAIAATCCTSCWRRIYVAENAWLLGGAWFGPSISPMDTVSFHWD